MTTNLPALKLTFPYEWQPKYVDDRGETKLVSVRTYYRNLTEQAMQDQKIDTSTMQLYPISEEVDFQCVIAFLHLALGELYPEPNQAKAQMTTLCKRMLQMHANLMSMDSVVPAEGVLHSKICMLWRAELKSYGDALTNARQREGNQGAGKMDEPKLPVLTNANVADLQYNLDQRLKDNNVPPSQVFSYCKRVLNRSTENVNECHAEILTAVANLQLFTNGKTSYEMQSLTLDDFIKECKFGAVSSVPMPFHLMDLCHLIKKRDQTWRQFLSVWDGAYHKHRRLMDEKVIENGNGTCCRRLNSEWELAYRLSQVLHAVESDRVNKLATDLHSRDITRTNAVDRMDEINVCLQAILDEADRESTRKRVLTFVHDAQVGQGANENKKVKPSKGQPESRQNGKANIKNERGHESIRKFPTCHECKKKAGWEYHRYIKSADGKTHEVCPKAPKTAAYVEGFKTFVETPAGQRSTLPIA